MTELSYYFFFLVLCFVMQMICKYFKLEIPDLILKCVISCTLLILSIEIFKTYPIKNGSLIVLGMTFGFIGDLILGIRKIDSIKKNVKNILMQLGILSFFIGHILYFNAFLSHIELEVWQMSTIIFISLIAFIFVDKIKNGLRNFEKLLLPCQLYAYVILIIVFTTFFGAFNNGTYAHVVLFIGAILFMISDLLLLVLYFSKKEMSHVKKFSINCINLSTYFAAQFIYVIFPLLLSIT